MEFRKATLDDVNELVKNRIQMRRERELSYDFGRESLLELKLREFFSSHMTDEKFITWIAVEADNVIATAGVSFYVVPPESKNLSGKVAYITNMYTKLEYRKKGIAKALLDKVVYEAKIRDCNKIILNASKSGRSLYEKYGFSELENEMVLYLSSRTDDI